MIALLTGLALLAGPFAMLGIWLWLRSRRAPVQLAEPLDIGRVLGDTFAVFRPENLAVPAMAALLIGLPSLVWQIAFQPVMQAGLQAPSRLPLAQRPNPFAVFASAFPARILVAMLVNFVVLTIFYVVATRFLVGRYERRPVPFSDALRSAPALVPPAILVSILAYAGMTLGTMTFVLPGLVLGLGWSVVIPVLVVERVGMWRSFGRSRALAIGSRGRILLLLLLMFVLGFALSAASGATSGMLGTGGFVQPGPIGIAVHVAVATISGALFAAFFAALYVELRRIREGTAMPDLVAVFA